MSEHDEMPQDERISALYRMAEGREPPAHLDEVIRREAQREIRRRRQRIIWPSLATAAVLVLSFTLVMQVQDQGGLDGMPMTLEREPTAPPSAPQRDKEKTAAPVVSEGVAQEAVASQPERKLEASKRKVLSEAEPDDSAATNGFEFYTTLPATESQDQERDRNVLGGVAERECGGLLPGPDAAPEGWELIYARLQKEEKQEQAECLRQQFRLKFGRDLPGGGTQKPDL